MGCQPDQWAREWLEEQRAKGKKGLTVEKKGSVHYLKWATTVWNKNEKKRNKVSEYLGVLNPDGTVTEPRPLRPKGEVSDVRDSGNAKVLALAAAPFIDHLRFCFPRDHPEIVELAFTRCLGKGELKRAGKCWKGLDDVLGLRPNTDPGSLSETLERIGRSRAAQDMFFERISSDEGTAAIDMSVMFSRSKGAFLVKKGYNRFRSSCTQFNILLACGMKSGRPQFIKTLAGNIKENSFENVILEFSIASNTVLVMDRAYCSKDIMDKVTGLGMDFVVAAKRNSSAYGHVRTGEGMFVWNKCAVSYGHAEYDGMYAYRFENLSCRNDELADALTASERSGKEVRNVDRAGNLILFSSREMEPKDAYRLYKLRCSVEQCFDTAKNVLSADRTYMHSDERIMGHCFVTFVALCIWTEISIMIDAAGLSSVFTVTDVLDTYASMKKITINGEDLEQTPGKDVRDLDEKLGLNLYPGKERRTAGHKPRPPHSPA